MESGEAASPVSLTDSSVERETIPDGSMKMVRFHIAYRPVDLPSFTAESEPLHQSTAYFALALTLSHRVYVVVRLVFMEGMVVPVSRFLLQIKR